MVFDPRTAKSLQPGESIAVDNCPGLRLKAFPKRKSWVYRYRDVDDKLKSVTLGIWPLMSLSEAMALWEQYRSKRSQGADLVKDRAAQRQELRAQRLQHDDTYRVTHIVDDFIQGHLNHERKPEGALAAARILQRALQDFPDFAQLPASEVTRNQAFELLESRKSTPTIAQKLRSLMGSAWAYALDAGRIPEETPNWWKSVMQGRLKSKGKLMQGKHIGQRRRALNDDEVGLLLRWMHNMHDIGRDVLVMYLWTGTRGAEILAMKPEQLEEKDGVLWWTIPKELTKNARFQLAMDLRVPLFGRAREVVERRLVGVRNGRFVFRGTDGDPYQQHFFSTYVYDLQPYSPKSVRAQASGSKREVMPVSDWTPHNLRRTARTMLAALGCPSEVGEAIVGHMPDEMEATYNAHTYDAERVLWLRRLSEKLETLATAG